MRLFNSFVCLTLLATAATRLVAQPSAAVPPPRNTVAVSLYLIDTDGNSDPSALGTRPGYVNGRLSFSYPGAKKTASIPLRPALLSPSFVYHGLSPLVFFTETMVGDKQVRTPLASVTIPPDWRQVCLLVSPAPPGSPLPYQLFPIRNDATEVPLNHAKLINLGPLPIVAQVNGIVLSIPPKDTRLIDYSNNAQLGLTLKLAAEIRSKPRLIYADTLPAAAGTRMLLLALPINERVWRILDLSDNGEDPAAAPRPEKPIDAGSVTKSQVFQIKS